MAHEEERIHMEKFADLSNHGECVDHDVTESFVNIRLFVSTKDLRVNPATKT